MAMILENDIHLSICPQSNSPSGTTENIKNHPILRLFDYGIKLRVNTDDLLLFNATITDQFIDLFENNIFYFEEIDRICKNAFL
ncbi:MAG: adenosine deaminase [Sediminicola sp.]|jgi:adenosine deaminase|tara:strand:+ start:283 stop:534 length:252 start_codon:yes stop_codon:yes gene_type:complete